MLSIHVLFQYSTYFPSVQLLLTRDQLQRILVVAEVRVEVVQPLEEGVRPLVGADQLLVEVDLFQGETIEDRSVYSSTL